MWAIFRKSDMCWVQHHPIFNVSWTRHRLDVLQFHSRKEVYEYMDANKGWFGGPIGHLNFHEGISVVEYPPPKKERKKKCKPLTIQK